jgi:hypothetical protein
MASETRPGYPLIIPLGGSYAQPSISAAAVPEGNTLDRILRWGGERNCGSPIYDNDYLQRNAAEYRAKFGEAAVNGVGTSTLDGLRRRFEVAQRRTSPKVDARLKMLACLGHFAEA